MMLCYKVTGAQVTVELNPGNPINSFFRVNKSITLSNQVQFASVIRVQKSRIRLAIALAMRTVFRRCSSCWRSWYFMTSWASYISKHQSTHIILITDCTTNCY